jgi:hypothetical protein
MDTSRLAVLKPPSREMVYRYDRASGELQHAPLDGDLMADAIAYYQTASYLLKHRLYEESPPESAAPLIAERRPGS